MAIYLIGLVLDVLYATGFSRGELYGLEPFRIALSVQFLLLGGGAAAILVIRRKVRRQMAAQGVVVPPAAGGPRRTAQAQRGAAPNALTAGRPDLGTPCLERSVSCLEGLPRFVHPGCCPVIHIGHAALTGARRLGEAGFMTAPDHLKITGPEDILGFIPHSLGYWPASSLVAMTMQGKRLGATLRVDLPDPESARGRRVLPGRQALPVPWRPIWRPTTRRTARCWPSSPTPTPTPTPDGQPVGGTPGGAGTGAGRRRHAGPGCLARRRRVLAQCLLPRPVVLRAAGPARGRDQEQPAQRRDGVPWQYRRRGPGRRLPTPPGAADPAVLKPSGTGRSCSRPRPGQRAVRPGPGRLVPGAERRRAAAATAGGAHWLPAGRPSAFCPGATPCW